MVRSAFQKNENFMYKVLESSGVTLPPDSNTPMHKYQPERGYVQPEPNPAIGLEMTAASNVNFCVELDGNITRVDVQEWFLYRTEDGPKWFAGEKEIKIDKNQAYIVFSANAVGFYAQIINMVGSGVVKVYASGDYIF